MLKAAGLVLNRQNSKAVQYAEKAAAFLHAQGIETFDPQGAKAGTDPALIITFGGDGTLLMGAGYALEYDIPLLGINLGMSATPLLQMLPYLVTIVVLVITSIGKKRENQPPASLGLPYFREER